MKTIKLPSGWRIVKEKGGFFGIWIVYDENNNKKYKGLAADTKKFLADLLLT